MPHCHKYVKPFADRRHIDQILTFMKAYLNTGFVKMSALVHVFPENGTENEGWHLIFSAGI
jgi:hypothetical protein